MLDLGTIKKGESKSGNLEYSNLKAEEHQVELTNSSEAFLLNNVSLASVKQNEVGQFQFRIDTKDPKLYGPVEAFAYVVVDGKRVIDEDHKLTVKANIVEDFSAMSVEQKQQSPIIEVGKSHDAGKVAAGKVLKFTFPVKNIGVNPLEIRRIYSNDKSLNIKQPKSIKSGKKGSVIVEINTKGLQAGAYKREVVIISNDCINPIQKVTIEFFVE
jgi:hypothetical protein